MSEKEYEVGYGKPPKHSQFKPGESGNPKGRPTESATSLGEELLKEGNRRRQFELNGKKYDLTNRELVVQLLYRDAMSEDGDLGAFETILKYEAEALDRMRAASRSAPCAEVYLVPRAWKSHCPVCGKSKYDEIETERKQYVGLGSEANALCYNGPDDDEQIEEFRTYRERVGLKLLDDRPVGIWCGEDRKKPRKRRGMNFRELLVMEGNKRHRVSVNGKMVSKSQREIAVMRLYIRALGRSARVRILIAKYETLEQRKAALLRDQVDPPASEVREVTLVFDNEPDGDACEECTRAFRKKIGWASETWKFDG